MQLDMIAHELGWDPMEIRLNAMEPGRHTPTEAGRAAHEGDHPQSRAEGRLGEKWEASSVARDRHGLQFRADGLPMEIGEAPRRRSSSTRTEAPRSSPVWWTTARETTTCWCRSPPRNWASARGHPTRECGHGVDGLGPGRAILRSPRTSAGMRSRLLPRTRVRSSSTSRPGPWRLTPRICMARDRKIFVTGSPDEVPPHPEGRSAWASARESRNRRGGLLAESGHRAGVGLSPRRDRCREAFTFGTTVAEVQVDPETGKVKVLDVTRPRTWASP